MEFLSDYIGGDVSEDDSDNDVFKVEYKTGAGEDEYKSIEDFINQKLKLGAEDEEVETTIVGSEILEDVLEDTIIGAFDTQVSPILVSPIVEENTEIIVGAFEEDESDAIKSDIEDLLKKL